MPALSLSSCFSNISFPTQKFPRFSNVFSKVKCKPLAWQRSSHFTLLTPSHLFCTLKPKAHPLCDSSLYLPSTTFAGRFPQWVYISLFNPILLKSSQMSKCSSHGLHSEVKTISHSSDPTPRNQRLLLHYFSTSSRLWTTCKQFLSIHTEHIGCDRENRRLYLKPVSPFELQEFFKNI